MKIRLVFYSLIFVALTLGYYILFCTSVTVNGFTYTWLKNYHPSALIHNFKVDPFFLQLAEAAASRAAHKVRYDGSYHQISYPGGDVPPNIGVCSDEIVRTYRLVGVDLQKLVHEDMSQNFIKYPKTWRLLRPDPNIDHRRVPNLMTFFSRYGETLPITADPSIYLPGDIVAWQLSGGLLHIGLVVNKYTSNGSRPLILHNIGAGPKIEDALFLGKIIGHFRFKQK